MYYNKTTETKTREDHACSHRGAEYSLTFKEATTYQQGIKAFCS